MENSEKLNLKKGEDTLVYYRIIKTGDKEPVVRTINGKEQEYLRDVEHRIYFDEERVKKIKLDNVGSPPAVQDEDSEGFTMINNYLIDFWSCFIKDARLTFEVIKRHDYERKGYSYVTMETLSLKTGKALKTIYKHLDTLEQYGLIYRLWCENKNKKRQETTIYKYRKQIPLLSQDLIDQLPEYLKEEHDKFLKEESHESVKSNILSSVDYNEAYQNLLQDGIVKKRDRQLTIEDIELMQKIKVQNVLKSVTPDDEKFKDEFIYWLEARVSKPSIDTWFKTLVFVREGNTLTLYTNNQLNYEHLVGRFYDLIKETVTSINDNVNEVNIEVI